MISDRAILHALRIKGFASVAAIRCFDGGTAPAADIEAVLERLAAAGLVQFRAGRLNAWTLTTAGRADHAAQAAAEDVSSDPVLLDVHRRFLDLNLPFKQLCTDWQLAGRTPGRERELVVLHTGAIALVADGAAALPRLAPYGPRLDDACRRVLAGDDGALTRPLSESYHDVWMELHQDLLVTLELERGAADGA